MIILLKSFIENIFTNWVRAAKNQAIFRNVPHHPCPNFIWMDVVNILVPNGCVRLVPDITPSCNIKLGRCVNWTKESIMEINWYKLIIMMNFSYTTCFWASYAYKLMLRTLAQYKYSPEIYFSMFKKNWEC